MPRKKKKAATKPPRTKIYPTRIQVQTWIVLPDIHASVTQEQDERSLAAVEDFMQSRPWDGYLNLGDLIDFSIISSHNATNLRAIEQGRILEEYRAANNILSRHERIIRTNNPQARIVWLEGNHEYRIERYIDANPALEGMLEVAKVLRLNERRIEWLHSWSQGQLFELGKCAIGIFYTAIITHIRSIPAMGTVLRMC
jgi:hypothetical protein